MAKAAGATLLRGGAYKPRTSPYAFQGLGEEALQILAEVREAIGMPVVTEVVDAHDVELVAKYVDMLQIGTRNMQNFALLQAVGAVRQAGHAQARHERHHRGVADGRGVHRPARQPRHRAVRARHPDVREATRNTLDVSAVPVVQRLSHLPVIVDPSHSGGRRDLVVPLSRAAIAVGADGIIVDVHPHPGAGAVRRPASARQRRLAVSGAGGTPAAATDGTSSRHGCRASGLVQRLRDDFDRVVDRGVVDVEMRDQSKLLRRERCTSTPSARHCAATRRESSTSTSTMFVSTVEGSMSSAAAI